MATRIADVAIVFSGITTPLAQAAADARSHIAGVEKAANQVGKKGGGGGLLKEQNQQLKAQAGRGGASDLKEQTRKLREQREHRDELKKSQGGGLMGTAAKGLVAGATFGAGMAGLDGLSSIGDAVVDSVKLASNFEQMKISFEVMLGSAGKADAMLAGLKDFAATSPLTFESASVSAKQLIAYGIAADQAIPTLRALTDVASGTGVEMGRLTLAYGQVATAGRLYGTELRQFTEAGVPIIDALATAMAKPKEAIKNLVEEGKVGFPEVVQAFKVMTEGTGKFSGMTERYGQSFAGQVEQMIDSAQTLKRELGTAIIQEMGLKEATRDMSAFADRLRSGVSEVKPAIRFVGDLARAGAQLGNEFAKAGIQAASLRVDRLVEKFPALKDAAEKAQKVLQDLSNFRIDPVAMGDLFETALDLDISPLGLLEDQLDKLELKATDFTKPFKDAAAELKVMAANANDFVTAFKEMKGSGLGKQMGDAKRAGQMEEIHIFDVLNGTGDGRGPSAKQRDLAPVGSPDFDSAASSVMGGVFPEMRVHGKPAVPPVGGGRTQSQTDIQARMDERAKARALRHTANELKAAEYKNRDRAKMEAFPAQNVAAFGAIAGVGFAAKKAADDFAATAAVAGGALAMFADDALKAGRELKVPDQIPARFIDMSEKLNKETAPKLDPVADLKKQLADLDFMESKKLITPDVKAVATKDAFDNTVKASGIDLSYKPPPTAEAGSREFAKLEASAFSGQGNQGVADLLRAIKAATEAQLKEAQKAAGEIGREMKNQMGPPVNIGGH